MLISPANHGSPRCVGFQIGLSSRFSCKIKIYGDALTLTTYITNNKSKSSTLIAQSSVKGHHQNEYNWSHPQTLPTQATPTVQHRFQLPFPPLTNISTCILSFFGLFSRSCSYAGSLYQSWNRPICSTSFTLHPAPLWQHWPPTSTSTPSPFLFSAFCLSQLNHFDKGQATGPCVHVIGSLTTPSPISCLLSSNGDSDQVLLRCSLSCHTWLWA